MKANNYNIFFFILLKIISYVYLESYKLYTNSFLSIFYSYIKLKSIHDISLMNKMFSTFVFVIFIFKLSYIFPNITESFLLYYILSLFLTN